MMREKDSPAVPGGLMLALLILLLVGAVLGFVAGIRGREVVPVVGAILAFMVTLIGFSGLTIVDPSTGVVLVLFGQYSGTLRRPGFWFVNPFNVKKRISLRVRNFESNKLKVNDHDGNPIEIGAVVVWKVVDTAEATFEVDNYEHFLNVQTEAALRNLATSYPYDAHIEGEIALRSSSHETAERLKKEIEERLSKAGLMAWSLRRASATWPTRPTLPRPRQRQQASAIIAARTKDRGGRGRSMVEMALDKLSKQKIVEMDDERKAAMVSNLLVVLCSDRHAQPVVNTGTLHQ